MRLLVGFFVVGFLFAAIMGTFVLIFVGLIPACLIGVEEQFLVAAMWPSGVWGFELLERYHRWREQEYAPGLAS